MLHQASECEVTLSKWWHMMEIWWTKRGSSQRKVTELPYVVNVKNEHIDMTQRGHIFTLLPSTVQLRSSPCVVRSPTPQPNLRSLCARLTQLIRLKPYLNQNPPNPKKRGHLIALFIAVYCHLLCHLVPLFVKFLLLFFPSSLTIWATFCHFALIF